MKGFLNVFMAAIALNTAIAFTVTDVSARQRYPWNNIIDVDFTIGEAAASDTFRIEVKAAYAGGDHTIEARTFITDPVVKAGKGRVSWAIDEDYPNLKAEDVKVAVTVVPFTSLTPVYMVVDLAEGPEAKNYPVRYTTKNPVHAPKAKDPCKTTQMWFRRIKADGTPFVIGSSKVPADGNNAYYVKLTKDYYIGVFETTQQQWYQMTGNMIGYMSNETWRATRPLDYYYPARLFTQNHYLWPDEKEPASSSLLKKLRDKMGLPTLNLPTESQWQYAACAGATSTTLYLDPDGRQYSLAEIARYSKNSGGTAAYADGLCDADSGSACVGSYKPNAFGLYDMIGNVTEDCIEPYAPFDKLKRYYIDNGYSFPLVDHDGIPYKDATALNDDKHRITVRGGGYEHNENYVTLWFRNAGFQNYSDDNSPCARGVRFCVTCE